LKREVLLGPKSNQMVLSFVCLTRSNLPEPTEKFPIAPDANHAKSCVIRPPAQLWTLMQIIPSSMYVILPDLYGVMQTVPPPLSSFSHAKLPACNSPRIIIPTHSQTSHTHTHTERLPLKCLKLATIRDLTIPYTPPIPQKVMLLYLPPPFFPYVSVQL
jgi:hypothetical protein